MNWIYTCMECNFSTTNQREFRMHQRIHEVGKIKKKQRVHNGNTKIN